MFYDTSKLSIVFPKAIATRLKKEPMPRVVSSTISLAASLLINTQLTDEKGSIKLGAVLRSGR
jgi:hypothetical protein